MKKKVKITNLLVMGDSLTDRGTMAKSALMLLSGVWGKSPHGRFTNGFVWLDYFIYHLSSLKPVTLIPPQEQTQNSKVARDNHEYIGSTTAPILARTYCKAGMTAHNYYKETESSEYMLNLTAYLSETLDNLREEALRDDKYIQLTDKEKQSTLVIEWSGSNDLISVNDKPTIKAARLAVASRIKNIEKMVNSGYCHFILFNVPNFALTPRFQNGDADSREQACKSVTQFNQDLNDAIQQLQIRYPACDFNLFDANMLFTQIYHSPEDFGFDKDKRHHPFLYSDAFNDNDPTTTAEGYIFWDEVHPTEAVHVIFANHFFQDVFSPNYQFHFAHQPLIRQFQKAYGMRWEDEKSTTWGRFRTSKIDYLNPQLTIQDILEDGLFRGCTLTESVMCELGWIDKSGQCISDNPLILEAWKTLQQTEIHAHPNKLKSFFKTFVSRLTRKS